MRTRRSHRAVDRFPLLSALLPSFPSALLLAACATAGPAAGPPAATEIDQPATAAAAAWARAMGGENREYGNGIAPASDGGVWVTGHFSGGTELGGASGGGVLRGAGLSDAFVARLDRAGRLVWAGRLGGSGADEAKAVASAPDGGAYVAGYLSGTADFDPGPGVSVLTSAGSGDAFVARLDAAGRLLWARRFGGPLGDVALGVAADADGNVAVTGYFQGTASFATGQEPVELTSAGGTDAFFARLTPDGELSWALRLGGADDDEGRAATADAGGAVFAGRFAGAAGESGAGAIAAGGTDAFALRVTARGEVAWRARVGGPQDDVAHAVAVDGSGRVWAAGQFAGQARLPSAANGESLRLTSGGRTDAFLVELGGDGSILQARSFGSPGDDFPFGLAAGPAGGVYLGGFSQDVPHPEEARGPRPTGSFVVALGAGDDGGLDERWRRTFEADGGIQILGLAVPAGEGPRVAGVFEGTASLDLGPERVEIRSRRKSDAFSAALAP